VNVRYFKNYQELSRYGADLLKSSLEGREEPVLCAASGNSPSLLYNYFVDSTSGDDDWVQRLKILALDEWVGVPNGDPNSCELYLKKYIVDPLKVEDDRFLRFQSNPKNLDAECQRMKNIVEDLLPLDVTVLGIGKNGHIGFNEPSTSLLPFCHITELSRESMQHSMAQEMSNIPKYGITLGMSEILNSKKILLLATGKEKKKVIRELLEGKITPKNPSTFLLLHNQTELLIDEQSLAD
jgi:galactosamine-6-phosphate isomerase